MFGVDRKQRLGGLVLGGIAVAGLSAVTLPSFPARADVDLSIAIPGPIYYTPPPAFSYEASHWYQPVVGGVYLGFGNYHHHYW